MPLKHYYEIFGWLADNVGLILQHFNKRFIPLSVIEIVVLFVAYYFLNIDVTENGASKPFSCN